MLILKVKYKWKDKTTLCAIFITILVCSIFTAFPIENVVYKYESPEEVSFYLGNGKPIAFCEGNQSVLVVYKDDESTHGYFYTAKKGDGYVLPNSFNSESIVKKVVNDSIIIIDRVKSTNDYYIHVLFNIDVGADFVLNDNKNSEFNIYDEKIVSEERVVNCIACIEYSKDYTLNINGTIVDFD